jgi:ribosomal protein S18 acetylase RimI-like enzyme
MSTSHCKSCEYDPSISIKQVNNGLAAEQLDLFSLWMSSSDPWLHFGYSTDECRHKLSARRNEFLIAATETCVVGFLAYSLQGDLGGPYIHYVVVERSRRSQGIGSRLIKRLLEESQKRSVFLTVSESNEQAKRLYESLGFQQIGAIPDYNKYGEAEFILRFAGKPKRESM